ncbi:type-F conjugative transfer system secretin TraK [Vibrio sp. 10N.261.46.E12]|uniref:type-F conjugative transfer system secretin TraK n=1 Tax=unclassified Vibrio TaxID=2614977 RepID=UPI000976EB03|nr:MULTISPECIES: type-F conjugative transfer system secretin TraK [unclassified Vibrio]OMO34505.1 hypothetical protein BH584_12445 [Vibrio sp. 10N.261.45.E1]PMJ20145.1 hypothetical protein BCU27_20240 [Vibrio sp. 10N.286.45.B6]PML95743.1 hypothetical protein BCT66_22815 [Vibrio sp. 10N.261.49.E11]PMM70914.1 hypothetical protein BCT48_09150 [Vibrio sp. 10N.261.46.F12]PMM83202.1 hypothetical protein BCT46_12880 [Vibrio sp. 10N.261.46.E8]
MNQSLTNLSKIILGLSLAVSANVYAAAEDVASDIPVTPMNANRIAVVTPPAGGPIANSIDQAILDAVSHNMPAGSVQAYQNLQAANVDEYGRPLTPEQIAAKAATTGAPMVKTENAPAPINYEMARTISGANGPVGTPVATSAPSAQSDDPIVDKVRKKYKAHQEIELKPGKSELLPVATGLQNRIATTFRSADVRTSDKDLPITVEDGFIYVTPRTQTPIGLIISENGMPETAVNLTLMPLDVPPVMVDLQVKLPKQMKRDYDQFIAAAEAEAERTKFMHSALSEPQVKNDPRINTEHADRATSILATVADGRIPQGFDMMTGVPVEQRHPCDIRRMAMYHEVGQRLVSGREIIDVVRIKNDINGFREIREEFCLRDDVIAVGVFDRATLAPGEDAELYILRDKLYAEKQSRVRTRPRLTSN